MPIASTTSCIFLEDEKNNLLLDAGGGHDVLGKFHIAGIDINSVKNHWSILTKKVSLIISMKSGLFIDQWHERSSCKYLLKVVFDAYEYHTLINR